MNDSPKQVAVLGSTGSIGTSALEVIGASDGQLRAVALSGHSRLEQLVEQAQQHRPSWVVATDEQAASAFDWSGLPQETELLIGAAGLNDVAAQPDVDIVLAAIVGSAGLESTWTALKQGKTVALANKETLVTAGPLVTKLAQQSGAQMLPVDSEHCAIFQALAGRHTGGGRAAGPDGQRWAFPRVFGRGFEGCDRS